MYFYEILNSIMLEKGLTIPEVARLSGLRDSTIRSIISRKNKTIALEVAFKLAKGLNVSIEELNGEKSIHYKSDEDNMNFRENLKNILNTRELEQSDLCRLTGIHTSLMSDYISGKKIPTISNAIFIADALNISLDTLVRKKQTTRNLCERVKNLTDQIKRKYGTPAFQALELYTKLDVDDQGEIRGEMKQMLKDEKYLKKEEVNYA